MAKPYGMGDRAYYEVAAPKIKTEHTAVALYRENELINILIWKVNEVKTPFNYRSIKFLFQEGKIKMRDRATFNLHQTDLSERAKSQEDWVELRQKRLSSPSEGEILKEEKLYRALPKLNRFLWFF